MEHGNTSLLSFIQSDDSVGVQSQVPATADQSIGNGEPVSYNRLGLLEDCIFNRLKELGGVISCEPALGSRVTVRTTRLDPFEAGLMQSFGDFVPDFALLQHCMLELRRKRVMSWRSYYNQNRLVISVTKTLMVAIKTREIQR